jgi:hypothetical protein
MLGGFLLSFGLLLFVLYQLILGGGGAGVAGGARLAGPTPIAVPANARRFGSLAELDRAGPGPAGSAFALTITEAELNARIDAALRQQPELPFRRVTAAIGDDRIDFEGTVRTSGLDVASAVGLRPFALGGRIGYEIRSIDVGPVPLPGFAGQAISDTIDRELERARLTEAFALEAIQARRGAVTLVGRFR